MRTLLVVAALGLSAGAAAQTTSGETFKAGVTMIQVPVVVRDHDGHTVGNLGKDDFQLFDNGRRQEIASFSVESAGQAAPDRSLPDGTSPAAQNGGGAGMAIPTRFVTYFFDDLTIRDQGDLKRIRDAVTQQLGELPPGDRAAIFTSSCRVELDFTNDRQKLQDTVARMQLRPAPVCRVSQSQTLQTELLKAVVRKMSSLPGRRDVILVSSGFHIGANRPNEVPELLDAAVRAKVTINAVDTGEATDYVGGSAANARNTFQNGPNANASNPQVLLDVAHGTGGAYVTGNDYTVSFRKLSTPESHYVLGFVPAKADGRFHQLKVKLENGHKLTVEARNGYLAVPRQE